MCCHEIQTVKAFHLKFKARLSWITAVLKIFAVEFNCVGNHFLEEIFPEISEFHPTENTTFMSGTYLKPSQTSKMKLLAKVVNTSRDVFRTVFSIQNVFKTSRMALFTKLMNGWKPLTFSTKSSILDTLLGPENTSGFTVFNYFHLPPSRPKILKWS